MARETGLAQQWERIASLSDEQLERIDELGRIVSGERDGVLCLDSDDVRPENLNKNVSEEKKTATGSLSNFYMWYENVVLDMEEKDEQPYREHIKALTTYKDAYSSLYEQSKKSLEDLGTLQAAFVNVSSKTNSLSDCCDSLVHEQENMLHSADDIKQVLSYFEEHDAIASKLLDRSMNPDNVAFLPLIRRLEECIEYLEQHSEYKDTPLYLIRFNQLQSKALSYIRDHFSAIMKATTEANIRDSTDADAAMHYVRFRSIAPSLSILVSQLEKRRQVRRDIAVLLNDCRSVYHECRINLLRPSVMQTAASLAAQLQGSFQGPEIHCILREGGAYLIWMCQLEYQLHGLFFSSDDGSLSATLQTLCDPVYETIRSILIRVSSIDTLCESVLILRTEILEDEIRRRGVSAESSEPIVKRMIEDAQERLTFRTETYSRDEITKFNPSEADLDYPTILLQPRSESSEHMHSQLADVWYPTVERTLTLLSKLYRTLDSSVFAGVAQELVLICTKSLLSASRLIGMAKGGLEGSLFLVRNLLILREQIAPFDVNFAAIEKILDFSGVRTALSLFEFGHVFSFNRQNPLVDFVQRSAPSVKENVVDSKKILEVELKDACEMLITLSPKTSFLELFDFLSRASVFLSNKNGPEGAQQLSEPLHTQSWATPDAVTIVTESSTRSISDKFAGIVAKIRLYVPNEETSAVLLKPIKLHVLEAFSRYRAILESHYSAAELAVINNVLMGANDITDLINAAIDTPALTFIAENSFNLVEINGGLEVKGVEDDVVNGERSEEAKEVERVEINMATPAELSPKS